MTHHDTGSVGSNASNASNLGEQFEDNYRHRRLSMHRNANPKSFRRSSSVPDDWYQTSYAMNKVPPSEHVDQIVDKIVEEEECLLGDGIVPGMEFRQDTLRNMPQSLTMKKLVKERLNMRMRQAKSISGWTRMKLNITMSSKKCKSRFDDFIHTFELWNGVMKKIEGEFGSATAIYFRFFRHLFFINCATFFFCFCFIVLPKLINSAVEGTGNSAVFHVEDIFTGQGYLENTPMFYGAYQNDSIRVSNNVPYSMPQAYFYTMIFIYVMLLIDLAVSMMRSYRVNFIETKGGLKNVFAHKVFCTWDFGIATENAARLKSSAIFHEFKELLEEELRTHRHASCKGKFLTFMLRLAAHLLVLGVVAAIGYGIWLLLDWHWVSDNTDWSVFTIAIIINAVIYIVPVLFTWISRYEDYKNPRKAFNITLFRTFLLHAAVIGLLAAFWLFRADKITGCWETKLGQEVYRLLIIEFVFSIGFFLLEKVVLCIWAMATKAKVENPEFEIAKHTVHLIYNQALFWLGLLFAPLLSALIVVKYLFMWYFTTMIEIKCSKPSTKFWRATNTQTWFIVITFFTALLIMAALVCLIALVHTSECGPFGSSMPEKRYIYDFLKDEILRMEKGIVVWQILAYLLKPGVVTLVIVVMIGIIYYLRAKALAQEKMVSVLREMIVLETKDKEYYLQRIRMLAAEWKFASYEVTDPLRTPTEKLYKPQEIQTEFHRNQETNVPNRAEDGTSMRSSHSIHSPMNSRKTKRH